MGPEGSDSMVILDSDDENGGAKGGFHFYSVIMLFTFKGRAP